MPEWALRFENFSALHAATVLLFTFAWAAVVAAGRRVAGGPHEQRWRASLCASIAAAWLLANAGQLLPGVFVVAQSLPLQLCDLAGALAPLALWRRTRLLLGTLYFWGLGFSVQAVATPDLAQGPASVAFWMFWVPHANIVGAACYALVVEGFRPQWRECIQAYLLALLYLVLVLPFDLLTGFNYGYVGPVDLPQPTLLDLLGPWPWRIGSLTVVALCGFVLLQLPWTIAARGSAQNPRSVA